MNACVFTELLPEISPLSIQVNCSLTQGFDSSDNAFSLYHFLISFTCNVFNVMCVNFQTET